MVDILAKTNDQTDAPHDNRALDNDIELDVKIKEGLQLLNIQFLKSSR